MIGRFNAALHEEAKAAGTSRECSESIHLDLLFEKEEFSPQRTFSISSPARRSG
jgi:hypothetical protein